MYCILLHAYYMYPAVSSFEICICTHTHTQHTHTHTHTHTHPSSLLRLSEDKRESEKLAEDHRKWKHQVEEECHQLREQRLTFARQCDELQQKLRASEQAREAAERRLTKEVAVLAQRHQLREKELLFRLEGSEDAHRKSTQELRELLTAQHHVGTR